MSTVLNSTTQVEDWLKREAPNFLSRETAILVAGSGILTTGTVLAKLTASGKWVPAAASGIDGSQTAAGVLFNQTVDATNTDKPVTIVTRSADAAHTALTYGPTINSASLRAAANAQLAAVGIRVREGA